MRLLISQSCQGTRLCEEIVLLWDSVWWPLLLLVCILPDFICKDLKEQNGKRIALESQSREHLLSKLDTTDEQMIHSISLLEKQLVWGNDSQTSPRRNARPCRGTMERWLAAVGTPLPSATAFQAMDSPRAQLKS